MAKESADSWQARFSESLQRFGPHTARVPSIDEYLNKFPLEGDDRWGPEMDELHRVALRAYVGRQIAFISNDLELALHECASPPECAMLYALATVAWDWADGVLLRVKGNASGLIATRFVMVEIEPQAQIGEHRVDFLLTMSLRPQTGTPSKAQLIVECDGHEWHERTREQAAKDRARDRDLQARDLAVFRYTGSEVWRDVFAAALEAMGELARRFD